MIIVWTGTFRKVMLRWRIENSIQIHINTNNSTSCNQANTAFTVPNYVSTINVQILVKSVAITP